MKKISIIITTLVISLSTFAQKDRLPEVRNSCDNVSITDVKVERADCEINVSFRVVPAKNAVRSNYKMTLTPYLYNDSKTVKLQPVEVIGKRWARKERQRQLLIGEGRDHIQTAQVIPENKPSSYSVSIPFDRNTMSGMSLRIEQSVEGCCNSTLLANQSLANGVQLYVEPTPIVQKVTRTPVLTKVNSKWQFSKNVLTIHFRVNSTNIDQSFFDNKQTIYEIISIVDSIHSNKEWMLRKIEISGFASPEGVHSKNQRLAINRAVALKNYIQQEIPHIADTSFILNNGGENWDGVRNMVEASDIKYRDEVLAMLNKTPVDKKELQDLRGGQPYKYMVGNFFSSLRTACCIAVYYDILADEEADTINDALILIDKKEYRMALDKLQSAKSDPRAYNAIGVCYMMTRQEPQAKEWFDKAVAAGCIEAIKNLNQIK